MRPQRPIDDRAKDSLAQILKRAKNRADFQRVQCLWLRASLGLDHKQVAQAIGWSESHVKHVWGEYFKRGEEALMGSGRGGRRRENLTIEEEKQMLASFGDVAAEGRLLVVNRVKAAYENRLGRSVPKSTVYRMLARHGWRKIMPRPRHPKNDPTQALDFKKNSPSLLPKKLPAKSR